MSDSASTAEQSVIRLLHPRYWLSWLGMGALRLVAALPLPIATRLGAALGTLLYPLARRRRRIVQTNLRLCFPELDPAQREALARENFRYTGRGMVEVALGWWASDAALAGRCRVIGLERLEQARAGGRGVLLLCGHFTCLEMAGRFLSQILSFDAVYRPHENPVVEYLTQRWRTRRAGGAIPRHDVRGLVRQLKAGRVVFYLPDQDYGRRHSVFAPFFGIPAATVAAVPRLAQMGNAAVMPLFYRIAEDGCYELTFGEPFADYPSGDAVADATRINEAFEQAIRRAPAQYLWVHRRFKTRPEGEPGFYGR